MDKKSKILLLILVLSLIYAIGSSYYRFYISKDYQVTVEISCDPETEKCFVYEDEETGEVSYYKIINKNASNILICDQDSENCSEPICEFGESNCEIIECDEGEGIDSCDKIN
ncbi:MAG TPA: hypothetical protein PKE08_00225 [Candidatus Paceibacterota bacterium]|nr:hypothetical protein [Candidatus Paceibacterota bacterium]